MSNIETGGPAFPVESTRCFDEFGMTLRDYFAAKALPTIYQDAMEDARQGSGLLCDDNWRFGLALDAYLMADAMLEARKGGAA
jgi:hypothetical protein